MSILNLQVEKPIRAKVDRRLLIPGESQKDFVARVKSVGNNVMLEDLKELRCKITSIMNDNFLYETEEEFSTLFDFDVKLVGFIVAREQQFAAKNKS